MPTYTPPSGDAVDFSLEIYAPPAGDAVDFELGIGPFEQTGSGGGIGGADASIAFAEPMPAFVQVGSGGGIGGGEFSVQDYVPHNQVGIGGGIGGGAAVVEVFEALPPGVTGAVIHTPDFTPVAAGALRVLNWQTSRYQNAVGKWEALLPVDDALIDGQPLHRLLRRGWHVSLVQERNVSEFDPAKEYRLYLGVIQEREYRIAASGRGQLALKGAFRALHLTDRMTLRQREYSASVAAIAEDLVDGDEIIGPDGGIILPAKASEVTPTVRYTDQSLFAALLRTAGYGRMAYRESWDKDRPEFTVYDRVPNSGVLFTAAESYDPSMDLAGETGVGFISGAPTIRYDGLNIVNRIIPYGSDTPDGDLTLQHASTTSPYTVKSGINPDATTYYYIEDEESIARYGLVETTLFRGDVRNPVDSSPTRIAAANVLYAIAAGELLRRKAEWKEVTIDVANGSNIWSLPGDMVRLQYAGVALTEEGRTTWLDEDGFYLVTERHDASQASGVRKVRFVLSAPEADLEIPPLPEAPEDSPPDYSLPPPPPPDDSPGDDRDDPDRFPTSPDCCGDENEIEDGAEPPPGDVQTPAPPIVVLPPPEPEPPPPGESSLAWSSLFAYNMLTLDPFIPWGSTPNNLLAPTSQRVVLVLAARSDSAPTIAGITNVNITELASHSFQAGLYGPDFSPGPGTVYIKVWLVESTGPGSDWRCNGASESTPGRGAAFVLALIANQSIPAGVTVESNFMHDATIVAFPTYDITQNVWASVPTADAKDAVASFVLRGGGTADTEGSGLQTREFNGIHNEDLGLTSSWYNVARLGPTIMPSFASYRHRRVFTSSPGNNAAMFLLIQDFRIRLNEA